MDWFHDRAWVTSSIMPCSGASLPTVLCAACYRWGVMGTGHPMVLRCVLTLHMRWAIGFYAPLGMSRALPAAWSARPSGRGTGSVCCGGCCGAAAARAGFAATRARGRASDTGGRGLPACLLPDAARHQQQSAAASAAVAAVARRLRAQALRRSEPGAEPLTLVAAGPSLLTL